jgi:arsenite methyltransferase
MAERVFARKMEKVGFREVWIGERTLFGIEGTASYPLFTPEIIDLMRRLLPPERQVRVAISVIARARKPVAPRTTSL